MFPLGVADVREVTLLDSLIRLQKWQRAVHNVIKLFSSLLTTQVPYSQHLISLRTNKLDCSIKLSWKGLPVPNTLTYRTSS
jgi:hypothetical protein